MKSLFRRSRLVLGSLVIALSLIAPSTAQASTLPSLRLSWSLPGGHDVRLAVTGANSRAWRITAAGQGSLASYRISVTVNTGDVGFYGDVSYLHRDSAGRWIVTRRYNITPYLGSSSASIGGCAYPLGICWSTTRITVPRDGNGTMAVRFHSQYAGRPFAFTGAIRRAGSEPFVWGPWLSAPTVVLRP